MVSWVFEREDDQGPEAAALPQDERLPEATSARGGAKRARSNRKPRHKTGNVGRSSVVSVEIKNLAHAIAEITTAREELVSIDAAGLDRHQRSHARVEPMSRLVLVRRYLEEITSSHERRRW